MSRPVILAALALFAGPAAADPPDPLDLARGLRDAGHPDLAVDYLDALAAKAPPAAAAVLPLERARARLDLAAGDADDGRRDGHLVRAQAEFEEFLAANPGHPRRPEAAVSLARVVAARAKALLARADRGDDPGRRKADLAKARPVFEDAAARFGAAADAVAKQLDDPALSAARRRDVTRDVLQAEFDRAANQFLLARTYDPPDGAPEVAARGKALDAAKALFQAVGKRDDGQPLCWVARAWAGECDREKGAPVDARKAFDAVKQAAGKNPAAAAGARQARFFESKDEYEKAFGANTPAAFAKAQAALDGWLADPAGKGPRPGPEAAAARFYAAVCKHRQARLQVREDPKTKQPVVPPGARALLQAAEKDYRRLAEADSDYAGKAAEQRTEVLRLLVGDGDRDPAALTGFDECLMAAQVQLARALKESGPDSRAARLGKAAALFERAGRLPAPRDAGREAVDGQVSLAFTYLAAGRPHEAAVLGEHLARTAKAAGPAARAGLYAVQGYLQAAAKGDPADADGRAADLARAARVAGLLDKQFPADPSTDAARVQLAQAYSRDGRHRDAFALLARVTPTGPRAAAARLLEGAAAIELLRPRPGDPGLSEADRAEVLRRVVADLEAVPDLPPTTPGPDARLNVLAAVQLAELHLLAGPAGYPRAEQAAAKAAARAQAFHDLPPEAKDELRFQADHARLRAVLGRALPAYQAGRFADALAVLDPVLTGMAKDGPAAKPDQPPATAAAAKRLDDFRRDAVLVLALQARLKGGAAGGAAGLVDLLGRLGGGPDATADALAGLVAAVRPQVDALRRADKAADADALAAGVAGLLEKVAADPKVPPRLLVFAGRGLREVGRADRAADVLQRVPAPPPADLAKKAADLDESARRAVVLYRGGRLELARALRQAKRFADADGVLRDALGAKDAPGWAAGAGDFRREAAYLAEARAADAADPKEAFKLWAEARGRWTELAAEYLAVLRRRPPADEPGRADLDRLKAQAKPVYHDLFFESLRCLAAANTHLLKDKPADLAAKLGGVARQMVALEAANPDLPGDLKARFAGLLDEYPGLKAEYVKQAGKAFLRQPGS